MKKKILYSLILAVVMVFNALSVGCSFMGTDSDNYNDTIVATIGDDIKVKKSELINLYNAYGYSYVENGDYDLEGAINALLDQIINKHVMTKYLEDNYKSIFNAEKLEDWEENEIWEATFKYADDQVLSYVNDIRKAKGLEEISTEEKEEASETTYIRKDYQPKVIIDNDGVIRSVVENTHKTNIEKVIKVSDFEFEFHGNKDSQQDQKINELAKGKFYNYLRTSRFEDTKLTDNEALVKFLNEMYKEQRGTYLISKYQEEYKRNKEIDPENILLLYRDIIKNNNAQYSLNKDQYIKDAQKDVSSIYYHPFNEELIYVSHILIKYDYNDTDLNLKTEYANQLSSGLITPEEYIRYMQDENLGSQCQVYEINEEGKFDEPTDMNAIELYNKIDDQLSRITNLDDRLDKFVDLTYKYNQDTGLFTSKEFYTIQLNESYEDTMVKEFADLSRKLYKEQGVGSYGICMTQYGAHIVYVAGVVNNRLVSSVNEPELNAVTIDQLRNVEIKNNQYNFGTYTLFDILAEQCIEDDYSSFEQSKLVEIKETYKDSIVRYVDRYKDLYETN